MTKTRQQRLAEERAGHPPSPPQFIENKPKPRGPKRTLAKTPSATEVAGPVVPATQLAVKGEHQALLHVWVDAGPGPSGCQLDDPTHQLTIPSSYVPELVTFIGNLRNQNKKTVPKSSSKPWLGQLTTSQEMAEPEPAQHQTANKLPIGRKSAFRRNPLLPTSAIFKSQLVEPSVDTSTANAISSLQVDSQSTQEETLAPKTPKSSKWRIGNLFQSARTIKQRLGFSTLALVLESPESSSQTPTVNTAQSLTETTATAQPKKQSSPPASARDNRARDRRHDDLVIKPVSSTAASKVPRDKVSRAKEPSPEFSESDEGNCPAVDSQMETKAPTAEPVICWPSRSLDRMNQNKRKRWGDPVAMPSPKGGSYGLLGADSQRNSEEGETEERPGKIRRTRESQVFTSQRAGHHNNPPPYEYQGGNIFIEDEAARKAANATASEQTIPKTPIPITNPTGTFKVPSPGDSDWSDSGSEEEEGNTAGMDNMTPSRSSDGEFKAVNRRYRPSIPSDPQQIFRPSEYSALRKARDKALQNKPRNPSRLSQSSRAYQSPSPPDASKAAEKPGPGPQEVEKASNAVHTEAADAPKFTAYEDWRKTAPSSVTAALDKMEVDSDLAGHAFARGLEDTGAGRTKRFTAYEEWSKTAPPTVTTVLETMEVESDFAGQAFKSGLDNFINPK